DFIGNRNIIDSAKATGAKRFIFITVIGTGQSHDALPPLARRGHKDVIALKEKAEDHLRASGLAYTIIRPGGFSNGQTSGNAKLTEDHLAFSFIARIDVANLAIEALGNNETIDKTFNAYDKDMLYLHRMFMD
ncbi:NAD(P)H-binding protein, partial [Gammaproteobacteria bacterium]|nr:NAD(P)H-binding protein [Gammaproteobacteria bacterium]